MIQPQFAFHRVRVVVRSLKTERWRGWAVSMCLASALARADSPDAGCPDQPKPARVEEKFTVTWDGGICTTPITRYEGGPIFVGEQ